ncbi:MarR family transcriptional regulator [Nguyenibacter sp. L1]|uniref:MarR family winged helix-turn-helix transcriptional regulator n=1 Tax=Nguyenibacter sp. L1 TaxID=3049350 RepID=UPI002B494050|nr:MarR family transcriptional regulator [Nguyenibacter sp. L1]WRH88672.1 MarR family transcriptional regulator [Nguyenibacter sp. L1]
MDTDSAQRFRQFSRSLIAAHVALLKHGDAMTSHFGQSSARWRVLLRISEGDRTVPTVARSSRLTRQAVQRVADELATEGCLIFSPDETDKRTQRVSLTDKGNEVLAQLERNFEAWASRTADAFPLERLEKLARQLDAVAEVLETDLARGATMEQESD